MHWQWAITAVSLFIAVDADPGSWADARALAAAVLVPLVTLAAAIGNVARLRFFSPADIGGDDGSLRVQQANAMLRNTVEQAVLAIPTYALLAWTRTGGAALLLTLAALFGIGRLLFWRGYARGAAGRALGFALTFYPTVGALVIAAANVIGLAASTSMTGTPSRIG